MFSLRTCFCCQSASAAARNSSARPTLRRRSAPIKQITPRDRGVTPSSLQRKQALNSSARRGISHRQFAPVSHRHIKAVVWSLRSRVIRPRILGHVLSRFYFSLGQEFIARRKRETGLIAFSAGEQAQRQSASRKVTMVSLTLLPLVSNCNFLGMPNLGHQHLCETS